jgi:hypothetical protein
MKSINIYSLLLTFFSISIFLTSCEDKIDVTLDDADAIIVIDAFLTNTPGEVQKIVVTNSQSYFDNGAPMPVEDANVAIGVDDVIVPFDYKDGIYIWQPDINSSISDIGSTYTLYVTINNVTYSSTTELGRSPEIEEIRQETRENEIGALDGGTYCEVIARDYEGKGDTYWIKTFKNGNFLNRPEEINLAFDGGFDQGAQSDGLIFIPPIRELINPIRDSTEIADDISPWTKGDVCRVEIHSLSNSTFAFMELLRDQLLNGRNGIFAEPLANSPSNIIASDGSIVLGAFNVAQVTSLELLVE